MDLKKFIRDVPDFPKPGIVFKDITPLLGDPMALKAVLDRLTEEAEDMGTEVVAGIESRGFLFGLAVAARLGVGFVPVRKPGKLPWKTNRVEYVLEYGSDAVEIHKDAVAPGARVLVLDDLLATGGTAGAASRLLREMEARVVGGLFVIELGLLRGRERLGGMPVRSLVRFP